MVPSFVRIGRRDQFHAKMISKENALKGDHFSDAAIAAIRMTRPTPTLSSRAEWKCRFHGSSAQSRDLVFGLSQSP